MPTAKVNGKTKHFPYTSAGKAAAAKARAKVLPAQASSTAKSKAFGQQGAAKRKSR